VDASEENTCKKDDASVVSEYELEQPKTKLTMTKNQSKLAQQIKQKSRTEESGFGRAARLQLEQFLTSTPPLGVFDRRS
jgi:hypothetical protein